MIGIVVAIREELTEVCSNNKFVAYKLDAEDQPVFTSQIMPEVAVIESGMGKANAINATKSYSF